MTDILARMRQIVGLTADWGAHDLVLGDGEVALERTGPATVKARVGDGTKPFSQCPYLSGALDLTAADARYVQEAETFTTGGAPAANKWPRLGSDGKLDSTLVTIPAALRYKGTIDPTGGPPASPAIGDLWIAANDGVVDASWGAPAAGQLAHAGDWLLLNSNTQWQVVPMTAGIVSEAPSDNHTYGRKNGAWSDLANTTDGFVLKAGDTMTGGLGINGPCPPSSYLGVNGEVSLLRAQTNTIHFNGYNDGSYKLASDGYSAALSYDGTNGTFGIDLTNASGVANAPASMVNVAAFDKNGGFYVGSAGGDFGQTWKAVFRQDQNAATTVGVINDTPGANAACNLWQTGGTANSYAVHQLADNNGGPQYNEIFGSAVSQVAWQFGGTQRMILQSNGTLSTNAISTPYLGIDPGYYLQFSGANPTLNFDANDYIDYDRAGDYYLFNIGGAAKARIDASNLTSYGGLVTWDVGTGKWAQWLMQSDGNLVLYYFDGATQGGICSVNSRTAPFSFNVGLLAPYLSLNGETGAAAGALHVHNAGGSASTFWSDSGGFNALNFQTNGAGVGNINCSTTATAFNTTSDARLKAQIADAADDSGALIDAIAVRQFDWKATGEHVRFGTIAQELHAICPEAVTPGDDADLTEDGEHGARFHWGVDYSTLVPLLLAELQALRRRVAVLEMPT